MQPIDKIELQFKNIKIDLPKIIIDPIPIIPVQQLLARQAYLDQTENKKMLPLSRFWKNANMPSLKERCAQFIAEEIVKNNFNNYFYRGKLPSDLNELIDKKIANIDSGIRTEIINKKSQEDKVAFMSSLRRY